MVKAVGMEEGSLTTAIVREPGKRPATCWRWRTTGTFLTSASSFLVCRELLVVFGEACRSPAAQVSMLKGLTIDIGNEVNSQNTLLDGMSNSMFDANGLLGGTMKKIGTMMKRGGSKHMCYLVAFIVLTFLVIWWLMGKK
eukprot:TRINITY_DN315_c0_g1_i3.p1 TRINITY_DN315_c0_g1~~TRINITY_DN315_c0_g1_i3.p1  ORF type:complete len:140 (-),score=18.77 TRINITY_DN315_c0_g1_i3:173-592(-)